MARSPREIPARTYASKVDGWFVGILALSGCAAVAGLIVAGVKESPLRALQGGFILLGVAGFLVWLLRGTNYTLDGRNLIVRSGPLRWTIALDDITSVAKPAHRFRGNRSPALSMDRLEIIYGAGKRLMISPENQEQFLADLKARQ
jgi:hypothetical protein